MRWHRNAELSVQGAGILGGGTARALLVILFAASVSTGCNWDPPPVDGFLRDLDAVVDARPGDAQPGPVGKTVAWLARRDSVVESAPTRVVIRFRYLDTDAPLVELARSHLESQRVPKLSASRARPTDYFFDVTIESTRDGVVAWQRGLEDVCIVMGEVLRAGFDGSVRMTIPGVPVELTD